MAGRSPIDARIARARARLAANLGELQQRVTRARRLVSPRTYLASPWLKLGLGVAVGYWIGRRRAPKLLTGATAPAPARHGLVHAALRATVTSLVGTLIERAVTQVTRPPGKPDQRETGEAAGPADGGKIEP